MTEYGVSVSLIDMDVQSQITHNFDLRLCGHPPSHLCKD